MFLNILHKEIWSLCSISASIIFWFWTWKDRESIYFFVLRSFDEKLDSLKTPELDETKDPSKEEAEKKRILPLETYKRQLNREFGLRTQRGAKYADNCKSRTVPVKQVSSFS